MLRRRRRASVSPFSPADMRWEHRELLTLGAEVSAAATHFDDPAEQRWSQEVFGRDWSTARIVGVVLRVSGSEVRVRFDDGDEACVPIDALGLHGESLSRAQRRSQLGERPLDYIAGPSGTANRGSGSHSAFSRGGSPSDEDSDEAPLQRLAGTGRPRQGAPPIAIAAAKPYTKWAHTFL